MRCPKSYPRKVSEDYGYKACCFGGAEAKKQRVRSNIDEMSNAASPCESTHQVNKWRKVRNCKDRSIFDPEEEPSLRQNWHPS